MVAKPVSLSAFRKKYPGYNDLSDFQVTSALHKKFQSETNSNISIDDFAKELDVGIETQELAIPQAGIDTGIGRQEDPQQLISDAQALPATPESRLSALTGELGELKRPDGGISTELSTTVTDPRLNNGLPTNIPILIKGQEGVDQLLGGKPPTNKQQEIAINRAVERVGAGQELPAYQSIDEAVQAAQARSDDKTPALEPEQPPFTGLDAPQDGEQLISDVEEKTGKSVRDNFWQSISKTIKNLPEDFQVGFAGAQMSGLEGELVQELERQKRFKFKGKVGQEFQAQQIKSLEKRIKQAKIDREKAISEKEPVDVEPQSLEYYGSAAVRSIGLMGPALLAGILTRNPATTLTVMAPQSKGEAFGRARIEEDLSREEAENYANATAAAEVIPELLPVSTLFKPGYKMFERVLKSTAAEFAQELVTEALQIGIDKGTIEPDMEWGEARQRLIDAGILAGISGPAQSAIAHPLVKGVEKIAEKAEQRQVLKDIDEAEFVVPAEEVAVERLQPKTIAPADVKEKAPADLQPEPVPSKITPEPVTLDEEAKQETIEQAAHEAATSPKNDLPEPTQAQKESGNYKKGHVSIGGLDIAIENPKGSERTGTDSDGETWSVTMQQHYGYIKRSEGADGDHVDVFLGDNASDTNLPVFVVNQVDPKTKAFDEHKVMMGFDNVTDARKAYQGNYAKNWKGAGRITKFSADEFKDWVKYGDTKNPAIPSTQAGEKPVVSPEITAKPVVSGDVTVQHTQTKLPKKYAGKEIFSGSGGVSAGIISAKVDVPVAGKGRYFAFTKDNAERYGKKIKTSSVDSIVSNPMIINDGEVWRKLTKEAGWSSPNPFGKPKAELSKITEDLKKLVISKGNDGIIIDFDEKSNADYDPKTGINIKLLRNVFDSPQVISYKKNAEIAKSQIKPEKPPKEFASQVADIKTPLSFEHEGKEFYRTESGMFFEGNSPISKNNYESAYRESVTSKDKKVTVKYETKGFKDIYRGESTSNKGGGFYTENIDFAKEFTQSGRESEILKRRIKNKDIFNQDQLPFAGNESEFSEAISEAKRKGFKALRLSEGKNQPHSIFIIDKSALTQAKTPKTLASQMAESGKVFSPKETAQRNELSAEANTYNSPGETHQPLYQSSDTAGFERPESGIVEAGKKKIKIPTPNKARRRESIRVALVNIIGPRLYEGKIRGKKRLGFFRRESGEVRVKRYGDVEVMAHEMAHFLDFHSKIKAPFQAAYKSKEFKKEIEGLSYTDEKSVVKSEGFAEFVRLWLTRYPEAKANAPAFTEKFEAILAKDKKLNKQMDNLQEKMHQWYYQGSDARLSAVMDGNKLTNKEKLDTVLHKKPTELMKQKTIDHIHAAKVIERQVHGKLLDATESGYKQLQLINGIEGIFAESTKKGAPFIAEDGSINFKGPALDAIFRKSIIAGSEVFEKHQKYFVARRAEELKGQDRENLLDQGMIDAGLRHATRYPYFKKSFEDYQEYRKNLMDFMVDTGYVEKQAADNMLRVNQNYVPFNRVVEGIGESFAGGSNFKRLKGGSQNIQNVYDNIVMGDFQHIKGSLQAKALRDMYESGLKSQNGSEFFSVIGSDSQLVKTQVDQMASKVASAMKEFDVTITKDGQVVSGDLSGTVVDLEQINKYFQKNPEELMFWTFGNQPKTTETKVTSFISSETGKRVWVEIQRESELVVDMLDNLNGWSLPPGLFGKAVGYAYAVKNLQTVLITSMPQFSIPNLVRDIQTATIISGGKFKPVYHNMLGFASILKNAMGKNSMYTEMIANGGGWAGRARSALDETAGRTHHEMPGHWLKPQLFLSNVLNTYIQIIDSPEMSTRVGYYIQQRKEGKSARESAFQAREISTDFRKHGSYAPFVMLQRTIPFHGAFVQSVDRDIRAFAEKDGETKFTNLYKTESGRATLEDIKVRMAIVAAGFAATALLLATMNSDEDWYQDLTEDERVRFFHIKVGGERYQIPKPHGFFSMIMQGVETFIDYLNQKEGADASKVMLYSLAYNLNSDFFPGIANPWIELAMNKNFADSSIVPPFLERASPELQFTERTPQLYVELGDALGISPLQANHIMKGYLGYLENFISDTAEMSLWNKEAWGERPFQAGAKQYFGKQFLPKNVPYRTRWIEKYYEARGKAATAKIDLSLAEKRLPFDKKMKNVIKSKTTNYLASLNSIFKKADKEASELREISMYIMYDKKLSVEQKEKQINDIRFNKNRNFKIYYNAINSTIKKLEKQIEAVNGG